MGIRKNNIKQASSLHLAHPKKQNDSRATKAFFHKLVDDFPLKKVGVDVAGLTARNESISACEGVEALQEQKGKAQAETDASSYGTRLRLK